ncbi:MAG: hypothetical protein RIF36_15645 [Imperialibacter sp.]|uniref:Spy/CpxP family protein refolding chaperone n=1 Tax=Imperialibacter sp. TaxID=2038411 RepID=UPI0032EBC6CF
MSNKMYRIGFLILLVINVVLVILFLVGPKPPKHQSGIKDEIGRELGFTNEQKAMFDEMATAHREAILDLEKQEQELVRLFFEQLGSENISSDKEALLEQMLQLEKDKIMVTYDHFAALKQICTEEQQLRFDDVMRRIIPVLTNSPDRPMTPGRPPF